MNNWQHELTQHFSDPCYRHENYTLEDMLNEYLAYIQHGLQHNEFTSCDVTFNGQNLEVPKDYSTLYIPIKDLNSFGYYVQPGQSAEDFINENWNYY